MWTKVVGAKWVKKPPNRVGNTVPELHRVSDVCCGAENKKRVRLPGEKGWFS